MRIAVSGGSIGGLNAALWLRDAGHDVDVFERSARRLEGRGAGIVLHESTLRYITNRLHLPVEAVSEGARALHYLSGGGHFVYSEPTDLRFTSWNTLHRSLLSAFDESRYHLGASVERFQEVGEEVEIELATGEHRRFDLLVCSEGISSSTRRALLPDVLPEYSGYVGWRGTVDPRRLSSDTLAALHDLIVYTVPPFNQALSYPIPEVDPATGVTRSMFNWVWYRNVPAGPSLDAVMTDRTGIHRELSLGPGTVKQEFVDDLRQATSVLPPSFRELISETEEPFAQLIVDLEVPRMVFGRVCLIGDGAFAARPHAAAGTAKAAEDGWTLSLALADVTDLPSTLARWEREQMALGRAVVERSRNMGRRSQQTCTWYPEDQDLRFGLRAAHH